MSRSPTGVSEEPPKTRMGGVNQTKNAFVAAYILLVGVPLLGLVGILKAGRHLPAPISVDGTWKITGTAPHVPSACSKLLMPLTNFDLNLSQSGRTLILTLALSSRSSGSGIINDKTLRASIPLSEFQANNSGCAVNPALTVIATVDPKAKPRSLAGTISISGCDSCGSINFEGIRQESDSRNSR